MREQDRGLLNKTKKCLHKKKSFVFFFAVIGGKEALERKIERMLLKKIQNDALYFYIYIVGGRREGGA